MKNGIVPLLKNEWYLMNQVVVIIHEYPQFGLMKVRYKDSYNEFIIDSKLLSSKPNNEHTINLGLLERGF